MQLSPTYVPMRIEPNRSSINADDLGRLGDRIRSDMALQIGTQIHEAMEAALVGRATNHFTGAVTHATTLGPLELKDFDLPPLTLDFPIYTPARAPAINVWADYAAVVGPGPAALLLTSYDGVDEPLSPPSNESRLPAAQRERFHAKAHRAYRACRRAIARQDSRRGRHWLRVAQKWVRRLNRSSSTL